MPRPAHTLVEYTGVFGSLATPIEEWSVGFRCAGHVTPADLPTVALAAETAWMPFAPLMGTNVSRTRTRVANIKGQDSDDAAGYIERNPDGSMQLADEFGNAVGTSGTTATMPLQVATVISLVTPRVGPTGKGRIFFPGRSGLLDANLLWSDQQTADLAAAAAQVINNLNAIGLLGPVSVVSSKGYSSPVTAVRVGKVPDTQRSRRHRRPEGYITDPL